jgi:hypothetical protein
MSTTTEPDPIRDKAGWIVSAHDKIEGSQTVSAHRKIAEEAERHLKEHQLTRETARAEVKRIQDEWVKLLEVFERFKAELAGAREALSYGQEQSELRREQYFNWQCGANTQFLEGAKNVASIIAAAAILKDRVAWKEKVLGEHVETMRIFGREHGIDEAILNQLSGSVG